MAIYMWRNAPGIYWSSTLGLISLSSDGTTRITIADKNLGATQVYNDGDTLSEANAGKYYQRGNNYGFAWTGSVTTSSTKVDASSYGPGNYYSSSTFITVSSSPYNWDSSNNSNIWGNTTDTNEGRRGPCVSGYHVPSNDENVALVTAMTVLGIDTSNWNCMKTYMKMPAAGGRRNSSADVYNQGVYGDYWSTTPRNAGETYVLYFSSTALGNAIGYSASGFSIRPFKNEAVMPDSSWDVIYQPEGLMSFEEIYALISSLSPSSTTAGYAELNSHPTEYYNKFNSEGHLTLTYETYLRGFATNIHPDTMYNTGSSTIGGIAPGTRGAY